MITTKQFKNFCIALFLIAALSAINTSLKAQDTTSVKPTLINIKLGKSGCSFIAGYSYNTDIAQACIKCEYVRLNSKRIVKRVLKRIFNIDIDRQTELQKNIWLMMPNKQY